MNNDSFAEKLLCTEWQVEFSDYLRSEYYDELERFQTSFELAIRTLDKQSSPSEELTEALMAIDKVLLEILDDEDLVVLYGEVFFMRDLVGDLCGHLKTGAELTEQQREDLKELCEIYLEKLEPLDFDF